ncbi:MAG TPA: hypothetical protein VE971_03760 [Candidatus Eisenbacteria bacterium]|nr:hypothetical protein [Candidatus Eisenbacteria bacterium]
MYIQFGIQKLIGAQKRLHRCLHGVTTILILSVSFVVLCYFIPSTEYSFAVNTTSNLLSSSIKQGPIKKVSSALNAINPSINATTLRQIPNNIAASVEKIKNVVNTTANDIRNSIRKTINDIRNTLLDTGIKLALVGSIVVAAITILVLIRRPRLGLDRVHSPLVKTIRLVPYLVDDAHVPLNLRTFEIIYKINTVLVQNMGWKAAKNCKGILNIGNEEA